jgi:calcineurin-like phosphoesterase family protein
MARRQAYEPAHIVLNIRTKNPIELTDFVSAFTSISSQYEKFIRSHYPEMSSDANIFVREVRAGSIEADLIPWALHTVKYQRCRHGQANRRTCQDRGTIIA